MNSKDPLNLLGFGIVTYRDLLYQMMWLFVVLSAIMWPALLIYKSGTGYDVENIASYEYLSLGNLGYSSVECSNIPIEVGSIAIQCPYGKVGEIFSYGVQPPIDNLTSDVCMVNDDNSMCTPNNPDITKYINASVGKEGFSLKYSVD